MSVDTKKYRDFYYAYSVQSTRADIIEMCDEIDRLRKEVNKLEQQWYQSNRELAVERENSKLEQKRITDLCAELVTLESKSKELAIGFLRQGDELKQVREQLRPRSIKDEPPPEGKSVLAFHKPPVNAWIEESFGKSGTDAFYTHWLPMPPAPPQPDAFEEWANTQQWDDPDYRARARFVWDAAIKSTKGKV